MTAWSPFDRRRKQEAPRTRGRRRQRPVTAPGSPGAVLTDLDAAHAAETARQNRTAVVTPAWERFGSQPAVPVAHPPEDGDVKHALAEARVDHAARVIPADTRRKDELLREGGVYRDYGTGQAYDISAMS